MTHIDKLLSVSSGPLAPPPGVITEILQAYSLGAELLGMLQRRNGFYAFESALHVFPLTPDSNAGLEGWNAGPLWRDVYQDLAEGLLCFAEDAFQDRFCLSKQQNGVLRFCAETGHAVLMAGSVETWAGAILSGHERETGWPIVHGWQAKNGPLPPGKRLMPKTPFFLGGEYEIENLWAGDSVEGIRLKADLAIQTRHLPDGAQVKLAIAAKP